MRSVGPGYLYRPGALIRRFLQLEMASVSQMVLFPNETEVDEEEEVNLDEFHRDAWDMDEDFILQQHAT